MKIKDQVNDQMVTVYRGAFGTATSVPIRQLVVGDIVQISQGDRVPADCVILDEMNLEVDESIYGRHRSNVKKEESQYYGGLEGYHGDDGEIDNHKHNPDFTLLSDTKVMRGEGRAIVCAVGDLTFLARKRKKDHLVIEEERTLLEEKLEHISGVVGKWNYIFCFMIFLALLIYNLIHIFLRAATDKDKSFFSNETLLELVRILILSLCLLILAIPEGMPLAISIAMAMSID